MELLEILLAHLKTLGLLKARGQQRTDSTHILAAVRVLNRLVRVVEWLTEPSRTETGATKTHQSHFAALEQAIA